MKQFQLKSSRRERICEKSLSHWHSLRQSLCRRDESVIHTIPRRPLLPGIFSLFPAYTGASQVMRKRDRSMDVITPLHPQKRLRHLHVIARSGAAAPRRGNPFSLQWHITKRNTLGKSAAVYEFALNAAYFPLSLRGYGLPRRFAPRNDIHKLATLHHIRNGASPILSGSLLLSADFFAVFKYHLPRPGEMFPALRRGGDTPKHGIWGVSQVYHKRGGGRICRLPSGLWRWEKIYLDSPFSKDAVNMEAVHCQQQRQQWPDMRKSRSVLALPMVNAGIGHILFYLTLYPVSNSGREVAEKDFSVNAVAKEQKMM